MFVFSATNVLLSIFSFLRVLFLPTHFFVTHKKSLSTKNLSSSKKMLHENFVPLHFFFFFAWKIFLFSLWKCSLAPPKKFSQNFFCSIFLCPQLFFSHKKNYININFKKICLKLFSRQQFFSKERPYGGNFFNWNIKILTSTSFPDETKDCCLHFVFMTGHAGNAGTGKDTVIKIIWRQYRTRWKLDHQFENCGYPSCHTAWDIFMMTYP